MDELGVKLMSWGLAEANSELLNNETLLTIGAAHGKTVAQVAMALSPAAWYHHHTEVYPQGAHGAELPAL